MTYNDKLHTPEWWEFRERVLEDKGYICENCDFITDSPHIHHCGYQLNLEPWQYDVNDVMVLCSKCHSIIHKRREEFRALFTSLSPANSKLLLKIVGEFTSTKTRITLNAWKVYRIIRDEAYDLDPQNIPPLPRIRGRADRYQIENDLLAFPDSILDPLLDACDYIADLPENAKSFVLEKALSWLRTQKESDKSRT